MLDSTLERSQNGRNKIMTSKPTKELDVLAGKAQELFATGSNSLTDSLALADALDALRKGVEPYMPKILALQNTALGFKTDKDPAQNDKKTGKPHVPYDAAVVKECVVQALARGFFVVNNEFNIIAGNFYAAKNGLERKVKHYPGVTDFRENFDVPRTSERGAIVKCSATWKRDGIPDKLETEIGIRTNEFQGLDATIGKAARKFYSRILSQLSGQITPEGEVEDAEPSKSANSPLLAELKKLAADAKIEESRLAEYLIGLGQLKDGQGLEALGDEILKVLIKGWANIQKQLEGK